MFVLNYFNIMSIKKQCLWNNVICKIVYLQC